VFDTSVSHSARIWNYWLGGSDNFAVDREACDRVAEMLPIIVAQARADRAFLGRAIQYLAGQEGVRQFLDIGSVLPTADNTHQVAQRAAPSSRIVYVDNDRSKSDCAHATLTSRDGCPPSPSPSRAGACTCATARSLMADSPRERCATARARIDPEARETPGPSLYPLRADAFSCAMSGLSSLRCN